jgi:hypothetical protein
MVEAAEIIRLEKGADGTFGVLRFDGKVFCATLELPDRNNEVNISCIPAGSYLCKRVDSPAFGRTFEISGVSGRSHILFHAGNVPSDTQGCVLLGRCFGSLDGDRGVLQSGLAVGKFLERCSDLESFKLNIKEEV